METPALTIKIKGADAINALTSKGQVLGSLKLKGGAGLAKGGTFKLAHIDAARRAGAAKAVTAEFEAETTTMMAKGGTLKAGAGAGKAAAAKGASALAASKGASTAGKGLSLGLGLGLGAMGPVLVLGALGLGALGIYYYRRNMKLAEEDAGFDDEDVGIPTL